MADIKQIKDNQNEKLKGKSDEEKALAAARRAMEEIRRKRHLIEPDKLASRKSDKNGKKMTAYQKPKILSPQEKQHTILLGETEAKAMTAALKASGMEKKQESKKARKQESKSNLDGQMANIFGGPSLKNHYPKKTIF